MERLQPPITPFLNEEDLDVGWLEEFVSNFGSTTSYKFDDYYSYNNNEEEQQQGYYYNSLPNLQDEIPLLQIQQQPNYFQLLLRLQHQKTRYYYSENLIEHQENAGCFDQNDSEILTNNNNTIQHQKTRYYYSDQNLIEHQNNAGFDQNDSETLTYNNNTKVKPETGLEDEITKIPLGNVGPKERRKRKRTCNNKKECKNKEEVESQRMSHIAVERNRRRQMNDHLHALRSLMPSSYVQRGDQASIIGGAIDYVKEMEQMLETLQAQKAMMMMIQSQHTTTTTSAEADASVSASAVSSTTTAATTASPFSYFDFKGGGGGGGEGYDGNLTTQGRKEEFRAENRSDLADIKVIMIQNHVNLKIQCQRRRVDGQLLKILLGFEELRLTILHLNITSLHSLVHYSFNLKMEDDCKVGSADEVVRAVHHILSLINLT